MTVGTYLSRISESAIIRDDEKQSIQTSIATIKSRLNTYFGSDIKEQFIFGSYTRGTILPRSMDEQSDIDYMIVFESDDVTPQAFLNRLKKFAETHYSNSELKQSYPTIQLKMNHITFELVPAQKSWWSTYKIPSKSYGADNWIDTDPNNFNDDLTNKNKEYDYIIKPLIRLMKYWNVQNGHIYDSFKLEKWIIEQSFYGGGIFGSPDLKQCLYQCFESLGTGHLSQADTDKVNRAKLIVNETINLERQGQPALAEAKIKKLIPDISSGAKSLVDILYGS